VRQGLIAKFDQMQASDADPREYAKPLIGPLQGYYRVVYSRYRALFSVEEQVLSRGDVLLQISAVVVAVGIRKEHAKKDVYNVAKKLVELGLLPPPEPGREEEQPG
jgi:mRNA interferase RelE/StbE